MLLHTIVKQICFPNGNLLFLSLFSQSKNWMHNVVLGCAEILPTEAMPQCEKRRRLTRVKDFNFSIINKSIACNRWKTVFLKTLTWIPALSAIKSLFLSRGPPLRWMWTLATPYLPNWHQPVRLLWSSSSGKLINWHCEEMSLKSIYTLLATMSFSSFYLTLLQLGKVPLQYHL